MEFSNYKFKNNPLNIRAGQPWRGLVGTKNGFCEFSHLKYCLRAALILLFRTYPKKYHCVTLFDAIYRYAPPSDGNNTALYLENVCYWADLTPQFYLNHFTPYQRFMLLRAMVRQESGMFLREMDFIDNRNLFKLKFTFSDEEKS